MKILVASPVTRSDETEADRVADLLVDQLRAHGHEVEHVRLPFSDRDWQTIPAQMVAMRNFDVDDAERVIALDFPAYLLRHEHKVVWLSELFLSGYDMFDGETSRIPTTQAGAQYRDLRSAADSESLGEARTRFSVSTAVRDRLRERHGISSTLLSPPAMNSESGARAASWEDTIVRLLA